MRTAVHPRFPDYIIREDGRIFRAVDGRIAWAKTGKECWGRVLKSGYRQHKLLNAAGEKRLVRTNRLVLEAFEGPPPTASHEAAHDDGVRLNNNLANLHWKTPKENDEDKDRHGTRARGEAVGTSTLTEEAVAQILAAYRPVYGAKAELARRFGVSWSTVKVIVERTRWQHVPLPNDPRRGA